MEDGAGPQNAKLPNFIEYAWTFFKWFLFDESDDGSSLSHSSQIQIQIQIQK